MSKIPQGEWNAITARYANSESISAIARSYGCTPPAIHYILKRDRQRPGAPLAPPPAERHEPPAPLLRTGPPRPEPAATPPQARTGVGLGLAHREAPGGPATARDLDPDTAPRGVTPGLDDALHHRAEAVIATFRSSFAAALTEASPVVHERLRRAASELMRVAARTTMVLDRLDAGAVQPARVQHYPRSAHARDMVGESGAH
jgi:hypothetical protein